MKKLLFGIAGAIALAAGIAVAQTPIPIVTALGLNDVIAVIRNSNPQAGNQYANLTQLRAWIMGAGSAHSGTPGIASCGGGSPTIVGTDYGFIVTQGTTATGCTVTFASAFTNVPVCTAVNQTAPGTSTPAYTVSATGVTLVTASTSGEIWDVICVARGS